MTFDVHELGGKLRAFESIVMMDRASSTLDIASTVIEECCDGDIPSPMAILLAGEQVAGHGRNGRFWVSPPGRGIWATLIFTADSAKAHLLPLEVGVATHAFVESLGVRDAVLKWPNDVLANDRKLCGILLRGRTNGDATIVSAGIGLNVFPVQDMNGHAISLQDLLGETLDLQKVTRDFVLHFDAWLASLDLGATLPEWTKRTIHREGDTIRFRRNDSEEKGIWRGLDAEGRALIDVDGTSVAIASGELIEWTAPVSEEAS